MCKYENEIQKICKAIACVHAMPTLESSLLKKENINSVFGKKSAYKNRQIWHHTALGAPPVTMLYKLRLTLLAAAVSAALASCPSHNWKQFRDMCYWGGSDYDLQWGRWRTSATQSPPAHGGDDTIHLIILLSPVRRLLGDERAEVNRCLC